MDFHHIKLKDLSSRWSRPADSYSHLHEHCNFTRFSLKTEIPSLLYSCRTKITCRGASLP